MKVKKIHIENYRMLKRIDIDLEENLSLIIGKNNCGKTSFLSILNKFIGSQSSTNNFTYNDFNSDFQDSLFDAINDDQPSWEKLNIKGIELYLFIEYDETDNLSNIQPLMLDLDPDNNIVILKFEYTISEQKFIKLISDFNAYCKKFEKEPDYSKSEVFDIFMRVKHRKYFEMLKKAILFDVDSKSASQTVSTVLDSSDLDLNKLICFRCISARRDTENKEGDNTLSSLSNRYYEKTKDDESNPTVANFEDTLHSTDKALSGVYDGLFEKVIKKVKKFGGIRENETVVKIISTLSQQQLLKGNTTVVYESNNHQLPESYNGLGCLNLISIIMEVEIYLEDFLKKSNETEKPADINLLFIEEPEAHTHPQLQYVFIKNIKSLLIDGISDEQGNRLINLQTIITSHSSHIVSECDFDDIKYFKRSSNTEVVSQNLKELETRYKAEKDPERNHFKFLKQYLTLNYSEIFFADKAILFEGETEGILLPAMLKKVDEEHPSENDLPLLSQNISLIASGAYSQIFDEFLSFIGIKTLIITDIDSGKESISKDKNGRDTKKIVACSIEEATHTTNGALLHYFETPLSKSGAKEPIAFFMTLAPENKILQKNNGLWETNSNGNLMIAYQTKETGGYYPRSFEDAFFQINRELVIQNKKLFPSLKCKEQLDEKDADGHFIYDSYDLANNCIGSKASFALDILLNSINDGKHTFSNWKIPPYIEEGLLWLRQN